MQYHPSQQIAREHETLFSNAILQSLSQPKVMVDELADSTCFHIPPSSGSPENSAALSFNQKLGHLYEDAIFHLLERSPRFQKVHKNIQVITPEKRTLGELDFLLWDVESQRYVHLELAIKFYLIHQDKHGFQYPGPDARDNYHRKIARLRDHQLKLTHDPDTQEAIRPITGGEPPIVQHLVHGIFFDHIHAETKPTPKYATPDCRRRSWLHCAELIEHAPQLKIARVVPKQLWLCEIDEALFNALVEVSTDELIELAQQRCTMFVAHWEDTPQFLAPNNWPNTH